jgi:AraC family transcriptional regulator
MNPVDKALWYIESHYAHDVSLEEIAGVAGVSRFHMSRAFAFTTGFSVIRYVRCRRLTEAARALANGAPDILAVALEAGYGSHEAFTRAFREQFGITPEYVREKRSLDNIKLVEPLKMNANLKIDLESPRFEQKGMLLVAGLSERFDCEGAGNIPALWQRFGPHIGSIPGQVGKGAYGIVMNADHAGNMDYMCAVEVANFSALPKAFTRAQIPPQRYAIFQHRAHISGIRSSWAKIWNEWMPTSGCESADGAVIEFYSEQFDARTGEGGVELWVPIKG